MEELDQDDRQPDLAALYGELLKFRQDVERRQDQAGSPHATIASNMNRLAYYAACSGERAEAVRAAEKCLTHYRQVPTIREETLAAYLMMLAATLAEAGRFQEAVRNGEDALYLFVRNHGDHSEFVQFRSQDIECMRKGQTREYLERRPLPPFANDAAARTGP